MRLRVLILCALTPVACQSRKAVEASDEAAGYLVLQKLSSSVAFYTPSGSHMRTITVGKNPHEMLLSADGQHAYVTDYGALGVEEESEGGTTVTVIDVPSQTKSGVIELGDFRRPHGIDLDRSTGSILVTTENPDRLLVIDPTTREIVRSFETRGRSSHMVTLNPDATIAYVSNIGTQNVSAIDLETGDVGLIPVGERPEGSDITEDGSTLFVACRESDVISIIDTDQRTVVGHVETSRGPNRVQLTPDESLLVYSLVHDNQIGIADVATRSEIATIDLEGSPVSLQLSPDGARALTASQGSDQVYVISIAERRIVARFETESGAGPDPVLEIAESQPTGSMR